MKKKERIAKYGEAAYAKMLAQTAVWREAHPKEAAASVKAWNKAHPEEVAATAREQTNKGGKYYERYLQNEHTGLRGERNKIRWQHSHQYRPYKRVIDPQGLSQIHHEWLPDSAEYTGVALVEADQHMHGFVDVIEILEGKITLLTEAEIAGRK